MNDHASARTKCFLQCGKSLTKDNSTKEHIIINAIGGRKTVLGFICKDCNSKTGEQWDSELAKQLNPLSLLVGITRQRGEVPSQVFRTSSGGRIELHADGRMDIGQPQHKVTTNGKTTNIQASARSMRELRKMLKGMRRKYAGLGDKSVDDLMANAQKASHYSSDLIEYPFDIGGGKAGRSLVKSAVALVSDACIDPTNCDLALDYLLNEGGEPCFGYYYDNDRDLVINRPPRQPFHCVYVKGDSNAETILAYVEFYSVHRMVMCLSKSYKGESFINSYAVDPTSGKEISIDVDLDLTMSDVQLAYEYEKFDAEVRESALVGLIEYVDVLGFDRAFEQVLEEAFEYAFAKCDAAEGEYLTDDQLQRLVEDIMEILKPFILHNVEKFGYVPWLRSEFSE